MPESRILRVAVPAPVRTLFDYLSPPGADGARLRPGVRVQVPFRRGTRCALLVEVDSSPAVAGLRLRQAEALIDDAPLLDTEILSFLRWAADYYRHPVGEVLFSALPVSLRAGAAVARAGRPGWRLTAAGHAVDPAELTRAPRQAAILHALAAGELTAAALRLATGDCRSALQALRTRGWIEPCEIAPQVPPPARRTAGPALNSDQQAAVRAVAAAFGGFAAFLLDGVTGSGKTEVYLDLARSAVARGQQVLVLVPEIGLTPQLVERFRRRLGPSLALLHSGLAERERESAWHAARAGDASVVIGTRSAVFTPLPRLGLVVVDEEHDLSLKQQEGFRYSARDLAVVRAQRAADGSGCPVVLGSATPSLESLFNVEAGRYRRLRLAARAGVAEVPRIELVDIRGARLDGGLSPVLIHAVRETLAAGAQVLLFLNRRGFAPVLTCHECGWLAECQRCDARLTMHAVAQRLWCHHCGAQQVLPTRCPACGATELVALGQGTERLESALARLFPDVAALRVDRDSMRRRGSLEKGLHAAREGSVPLLFGTQMLAKGHHFPGVTLVGILDADQGLFGADFRAPERTAQLVEQVAGRAGRADRPGRVLLQTRHPQHPLLTRLVAEGYAGFVREALAERREAGLPPFARQVLFRAEAARETPAADFLQDVAAAARQAAYGGIEIWGPVPAPMERRAGRYRAHLLLQAAVRAPLHRLLNALLLQVEALPSARRVRWSLDVDPLEML